MANKTLTNVVLQFRNDPAETWRINNPILAKGELGLENDTRRFKFGDGKTNWNDLKYAGNTTETGKTQAPTPSDSNYEIGTLWVDETNKKSYILISVSEGSATWKQIVTPDDLSDLGAGDMLKSQFATNEKSEQGYVDKAINADNATKLKTPVNVSISGDVTASATPFDGSTPLTLNAVLNSVVAGGTYCKVTVNEKGLVTGFETLQHTDVQGLGTAATKNTGISSGNVIVVGENGKIDDSVLPKIAITEAFPVDSEESMLGLDAQIGDIAIRSDVNKTFILSKTSASAVENWLELKTPTDAVLSVNGKTGAVVLTTDNIAEGSNLYFTEERATQNFNTNFSQKSVTELSDGADVILKTDTLILDCGSSLRS